MSDSPITSSGVQIPSQQQAADAVDDKAMAAKDLAELTKEPTESFEEVVEDFEAAQGDYQAMYDAGGTFKKGVDEIAAALDAMSRQSAAARGKGGMEMEPHSAEASWDKAPEDVIEIPTEPEIEKHPELEGYIEKVEKASEAKRVIVDDYTQAILLKPAVNQNPKVVLPLTEEQVQKGLHHQVWESIRWLAEWCVRQVKMLRDRAAYNSE